jgi:hypothetical protein
MYFVFTFILLAAPCAAQTAFRPAPPFKEQLGRQMEAFYGPQWRSAARFKTMIADPSAGKKKETSVWTTLVDMISGAAKEEKIKILAAYLYNMHISQAAGARRMAFDLSYLGALDPVYALNPADRKGLADFYYKNEKEISARTAALTEGNLRLSYNGAGEEEFFIEMLRRATDENLIIYTLANAPQAAAQAQEITGDLKKALAAAGNKIFNKMDGMYYIYKDIDVTLAMDAANSLAGKSQNFKKIYYRPVKEECAVCTYLYCREVCRDIKTKYDNWQIMRVYQISGRNKNGGLLRPAQGENFKSPGGKTYPAWDYHAAALLLLSDGREVKFIITDTFLLDGPADIYTWAELFDKDGTLFSIEPFAARAEVNGKLFTKETLPKGAVPYPVRK